MISTIFNQKVGLVTSFVFILLLFDILSLQRCTEKYIDCSVHFFRISQIEASWQLWKLVKTHFILPIFPYLRTVRSRQEGKLSNEGGKVIHSSLLACS